uniref:Uncharacterized protein n=1 Tax=Anguilla anguilla TaxID=7936 RepID=A0A0E9PRD1_ANGAN
MNTCSWPLEQRTNVTCIQAF